MQGSIERLSNQILESGQSAKTLKLPKSYRSIQNIVVFGMGGSALGAHVARSVFSEYLKIPLHIVNNYEAPSFVNSKTLAICSSYSGNTEETISAFLSAKNKGAKIVVVAAGGKLQQLARTSNIPSLIFTTNNNPCGSPRMGLGYSIISMAMILAKARLITFSTGEISKLASIVQSIDRKFRQSSTGPKNLAKKLSAETSGRSVWFCGSGFLSGNAHIAANQMNENAKRFAGYFILPEMNHHLLEGLVQPKENKKNLMFVFFESKLYPDKIRSRIEITKSVLKRIGIRNASVNLTEKTKMGQVMEALVFSSYFSFYSAVLELIDPTAIPFVDYFKAALKK